MRRAAAATARKRSRSSTAAPRQGAGQEGPAGSVRHQEASPQRLRRYHAAKAREPVTRGPRTAARVRLRPPRRSPRQVRRLIPELVTRGQPQWRLALDNELFAFRLAPIGERGARLCAPSVVVRVPRHAERRKKGENERSRRPFFPNFSPPGGERDPSSPLRPPNSRQHRASARAPRRECRWTKLPGGHDHIT